MEKGGRKCWSKTLNAMTKNLQTADLIVKLTLAIAVIAFYVAKMITGPLATVLLVLAIVTLTIFLAKKLYGLLIRD